MKVIIKYEDNKYEQEWKYDLEERICKEQAIYYINFTYPTRLQATTKSKAIFDKLVNSDEKEIKNKWESAINAKYKSKLIDSFNTKFKLFIFSRFLSDKNFDDYFAENIEKISKDFKEFEITQNLADIFSSQFYQKKGNEEVIYQCDNYKKTVKDIIEKLFDYDCIGKREYKKSYVFDLVNSDYRKEYKKSKFPSINKNLYDDLKECYLKNNPLFIFCDFIELISKTQCQYCGINIEQIEELGQNGKLHNKRSDTRGYSLEIDRKSPNLEYSKDNCCMACYWCNNAKTDEYEADEFKEIARGINIIWNERLKQINLNSPQITFPWKN